MARTRVGVLRGGTSLQYELSLKTGGAVLSSIPQDTYEVRDILIDKSGTWHMRGMPISQVRALQGLDVVWNGLHGGAGENGTLQRFFGQMALPYTGPDPVSGAVSTNKHLTKELARRYGIQTPRSVILRDRREQATAFDLFRTFPQPSVVKPISGGSSIGVVVTRSYEEFVRAIQDAFTHSESVLIEEYIRGTEATCAAISNFRNEDVYTLPETEIRLPKDTHLTYDLKMSNGVSMSAPSSFSREIKGKIQAAARLIHQALGFKHYSQSDFIVGRDGVYFIEANGLPDLAAGSRFYTSLEAVGAPMADFTGHILALAVGRK